MKRKSSILYKISAVLFVIAILCLITSMILDAVFSDGGFIETAVVVAFAGIAGFLAFVGIILACIKDNKDRKGANLHYETASEKGEE
jgi:MFS-type transporter involved in bile tolerance (Atg22 family)